MSGGAFDYLQRRYEWQEAIDVIDSIIKKSDGYSEETVEHLKNGLKAIKEAKIYLERIDYLLSCDDNEHSFWERLKSELNDVSNL